MEYFLAHGNETHIISYENFCDKPPDGAVMHRVKKLKSFPILNLIINGFRIKKIIESIKPDIVHVHCIGAITAAFAWFTDFQPIILTPWGDDILLRQNRIILRQFLRYALNQAALITYGGEPMKREIKKFGISAQKLFPFYWGIETERFQPLSPDMALKARLNLPSDSRVIISTRSLELVYDVETLIRAALEITRAVPNTYCIIGGTGSEKKRLQKLSRELGIENRIMFIDWIPYENLPSYLSISDIFLSTSLSDGGLSQSTGQALASGVPVIVTDLEVNREWIQNGKNGVLVPVKNPEALAKSVVRLLQDEKLCKTLAGQGRTPIVEKLDYQKQMRSINELYRQLITLYSHDEKKL
ncbi:MAG: hypothetical protein A2249_02540 [Candidatus Jacksonbacteria bacterium RIFOXYA2_FULL_44_7]|uniref:Glycosyl transferase family 1 domain-containing protein n=1 Tax=Candidatus Jacksonbacteria bacterium RIFCSPLOWO2_02_FULL_44_20 TaxID=1798460 RepID=A0A1G2A7E3_9BACT|nr:MAG: hypothetical protein A3C00_00310 [Candidatus Jacksonbacteria bacterium RIFCSPHIGHO2_02_FULL_44_25]OGY72774.1 MAG: hypothetical protein A3H61_02370 [Candidatus Jacksonbacteria bacterium RIFCSPLOWO2_02_FULL_44_20]OGY75096.1 MAG: hypothetical protein A3H07_04305 [Candidatus Jacksonbacteria bacterium RIFCSPLOWO2_12_FULL_44_15b]OGY77037.1 MAG: hypothetical protein A2249_02540 [Candidatus Jacksonbacteria bacterium RIFOXYA2_FULL_44_7]